MGSILLKNNKRPLDLSQGQAYVRVAMFNFDHDDIQAVIRAAKDVRTKYHGLVANPISSLPEPKAKMKAAIKDRIKLLAGAYIALAGFVDDDDLIAAEDDPEKTKAIYEKVLTDMETAQEEMKKFKIIDQESNLKKT